MRTNTFRSYIWLMALLLCLDGVAQSNGRFEALFTAWAGPDKLQPGVCVAVLEKGEAVFKRSYGYANLEYRIPLDNKSVFDIASLAKQFTGFAVARLITEGRLGLNDPAARYLPELNILNQGILIKHLVYHTSGLRDIAELFDLAYSGDYLTSDEALAIIKGQKALNFPAGTEEDYSNSNYVLLALIVERVSGIPFRKWCAANLFSPLKMSHSFVNDNPYEVIANRAVAYYTDGRGFRFQQNNGMALIGSSAVYTTIDDMIIWLRALQTEAVFPEVFRLMKQKGQLDNGTAAEYGFGLGIGSLRGEAMIEHSGATPSGFRSAMALFPDQSLAVVILSNWGDINPIGDFGIDIVNSYLPEPEREALAPAPSEHAETDVLLTHEIAARFLGDYLFNGEMNVTIRKGEGNTLTIQLEGRPKAPLFPLTATEFDLPALQSQLHFIVDPEGSCQKAEVWMDGQKEGELTRIQSGVKAPIDYNTYAGLFYSDELDILFEIRLVNGQLAIKNTKRGEVVLESKSEAVFVPEQRIASSLVFVFDDSNEVAGFLLNRGSRVRDLRFMKIDAGGIAEFSH